MKMDKLLNSPWFVKIVALFLGLLLYAAVNMETTAPQQTTPTLLPVGENQQEALSNVPLNVYYDSESYYVSELPQSVTVYLEGPSSAIAKAKVQDEFEVFVDLRDEKPGTHRVYLEHKGFPNKLKVQIEPFVTTVTIKEKVDQIMPVEVEFMNKTKIADGYKAEEPIVLPNNVKVSGPKEQMQQISTVKAYVDLKGADKTIEKNVPVKAFDSNGEQLDLEVEPSVVEVRVPITAPNKTVPLKLNRKGELADDLSIKSLELIPNEVTIFGPKKELEKIDLIDNLTVDLAEIKENTTKELEVPVPKGAINVNPAKVKLKVEVEQKDKKVLKDIPIKVSGASDQDISFVTPDSGKVDVTVLGAPSVLKSINEEDLSVVLYLNESMRGEQKIDLEVSGPQNVEWKLSDSNATVKIARN
ncbi:CdaR family protein [Bacillus tianshenii]|nr:CdaR family protein [Bacillus tianshenii]